jgi:hypothetical protein
MKNKFTINNKKAQLFTIAAILLITLMFATFEVFETLHERAAIKERVHSMDNFLKSLEKNLQRQIYISGYRIIFLAEQEVAINYAPTGNYMGDFDAFANEAFFNGTVGGVYNNITDGATYTNISDSINQKASKINVNISLNNTVFTLTQEDPWHVKVSMISDFVMNDKKGLASWNKTQKISTLISLENFDDPFFIVGSGGKIFKRKIIKTPYEGHYVSGSDSSNFTDHFNKGYYAIHSDAPNFLMRFEGNFSADVNGIESFVIKEDLRRESVPIDESKVSLDYIYFNPSSIAIRCYPTTLPEDYFKIDMQHTTKYNLTIQFCLPP